MSVRVSPVSRSAALLIILIGILTYYFINDVAGIIFIALGVILYWLLYRFTKRVVKEVEEAKPGKTGYLKPAMRRISLRFFPKAWRL